ncbi:MAG: GNAT family N-acetyltransferase [Anaerolineae bacterium]
MMKVDEFGLPKMLGDNLLLRWGKPEDAEELGQFNVRIHSDNPENPETFLAHWTRDLMNGRHPTTKADDFTVVVDQNTGKIVSSLCLIGQTWAYDGLEFTVGRPELVGTDAAYRRRGLVRAQMEVIHAKSATHGHTVQAITGIPWYYRQFGYEMGLDLGGSRQFFWYRKGNDKPV